MTLLLIEKHLDSFNTSNVSVQWCYFRYINFCTTCFNTSNVSVQFFDWDDTEKAYLSFNTSNVSVQFIIKIINILCVAVSIHQMCRFNFSFNFCFLAVFFVSIHQMCRFNNKEYRCYGWFE